MNEYFRIIDANLNRASEGLRVLEDILRFKYNNLDLTEAFKILRHSTRKVNISLQLKCINSRDSYNDVGLIVSQKNKLDNKSTLFELIISNFKRVEESYRVIEENLKIIGKYELSKEIENFRFQIYSLEKEYFNKINCRLKSKKLETDIYCITASKHSRNRKNIDVVKEMGDAGIKIVQYREKEMEKLEKFKECEDIKKVTDEYGITFIINDDLDIALSIEADGIHLGQDDLPVEKARAIVGNDMIIGLSTHSPEQAFKAVEICTDYIGIGPIYKTFTKKNVCDPVGLAYLDFAVKNINIPFVAIGGIKENNLTEVVKTGARCISLVTEITGAENITEKIKYLRKIIKENQ